MSKATQPHTAIVYLKIEVFPNLDTGECSGQPIDLSEYDLEPVRLVTIKGFDRYETIKKLKEKLSELSTG